MIRRALAPALLVALGASAAFAQDTSWRCTTIEICEGLSCTPDISTFTVFERTATQSVHVILPGDSMSVPFAEAGEGLLDDAPSSERLYVEREGDARASLVVSVRNPSETGAGISIYWPGEDVASSREIIGRCVRI